MPKSGLLLLCESEPYGRSGCCNCDIREAFQNRLRVKNSISQLNMEKTENNVEMTTICAARDGFPQ